MLSTLHMLLTCTASISSLPESLCPPQCDQLQAHAAMLGCSPASCSCTYRFQIENSHSTLLNNGQSSDNFAYTYTATVNPGNLKVRLLAAMCCKYNYSLQDEGSLAKVPCIYL